MTAQLTSGRPDGTGGTDGGGATSRWRRHPMIAAVAVIVVLVLLGGYLGKRLWSDDRPADIRDGTTAVTVEGMAARHGIKITLVAVTAAGGLVQLRYQVVDPDKADPLVHEVESLPVLVEEETGVTLAMSSPPHDHGAELELGGNYFFLMANAHNAVHRGSKVTLVLGDARLEHLEAQG